LWSVDILGSGDRDCTADVQELVFEEAICLKNRRKEIVLPDRKGGKLFAPLGAVVR